MHYTVFVVAFLFISFFIDMRANLSFTKTQQAITELKRLL